MNDRITENPLWGMAKLLSVFFSCLRKFLQLSRFRWGYNWDGLVDDFFWKCFAGYTGFVLGAFWVSYRGYSFRKYLVGLPNILGLHWGYRVRKTFASGDQH